MVSLADVLGLEVVARSTPNVVVGHEYLSVPVRWVHTNEMAWPSQMPQAGQLVLTSGINLPDDAQALDALLAALAEARVSGLVVLLGLCFEGVLPKALVRAAERHRIALVTLQPPAKLAEIAEAVNLVIADRRLAVLTAAEEAHQVFTELALEGAGPWEVVHQIALLSGRPVVLENLAHQVLAYDCANEDPAHLLADWEDQSRQIPTRNLPSHAAEDEWLTATVSARGRDWGRLLLLPARRRGHAPHAAPAGDRSELPPLTLKRGAETLALNQLIGASEEYVERQAHAALLRAVLAHSLTAKEAALRSRAMGLPVENCRLVGIAIRQRGSHRPSRSDVRCLEDIVVTALQRQQVRALMAALDNGIVAVLMMADEHEDTTKVVDSLSRAVRELAKECFGPAAPGGTREHKIVITVGRPVHSIHDARHTLTSAMQALGVVLRSDQPVDRPYIRAQDMRLTGLLRLLHDDCRLQSYVENELGPLLEYDARHGTRLTSVLACYLDAGRNKTAAAEAAQISRPSLYERLERIARILAVDLEDPRSCLSLQVATQALQVMRQHNTL
ncbi:PucR family transcriptional regulator ligand-binding domain-containing protein [Streptomyces sp. NPDC048191]|uniref:helix-turn-helix domain-containing protein n=1 Tax=Streptomyces sp. NPDC048191 TaxID=3155484 RepID=UPI0033F84BF4